MLPSTTHLSCLRAAVDSVGPCCCYCCCCHCCRCCAAAVGPCCCLPVLHLTFFAYVTTLSATLRSSLALAVVVWMRSCWINCVTIVLCRTEQWGKAAGVPRCVITGQQQVRRACDIPEHGPAMCCIAVELLPHRHCCCECCSAPPHCCQQCSAPVVVAAPVPLLLLSQRQLPYAVPGDNRSGV